VLVAYASDYGVPPTALDLHRIPYRNPRLMTASIDHSVWLHRRFRVDEWLLYVMDSPIAAGARGFTRGTIYSRDGQLVASVAQEELMRIKGFAAASDK
jgi:acyl-CoA thioesterase-2